MNHTLPLTLALVSFAGVAVAQSDHLRLHNHFGISAHAGSFALEGPAVNAAPDGDEEDVDMFGLRAEGHWKLNQGWYARGEADYSSLDGDAGLMQLNASIGTIRPLASWETSTLYGYLQAGAEYVRTSDLDKLDASLPGITRDSGDELGATAEAGLSYAFRASTRADIFAKYLTHGDGGVSFGVRLSHDLNQAWSIGGGVDAVWVEDTDLGVDLDYQRVSLGLTRKF